MPCPHCGFAAAASPRCTHCGRGIAAAPGGPAFAAGVLYRPTIFGVPGVRRADPLTVTALTAETFASFCANFLPVMLLSALTELPNFLADAIPAAGKASPQALAAILLRLCAGGLNAGAVTWCVLARLRERAPDLLHSLAHGIAGAVAALPAALLSSLCTTGGLALLVVPGLIVWTRLLVAPSAVVEEKLGPLAALRRSSALTAGYRGRIFLVFVFITLVNVGVAAAAATLMIHASGGPLTVKLVELALLAAAGGLVATSNAVIYHRLRGLSEPLGEDRIAAVFD
jgi:hypothetical protein